VHVTHADARRGLPQAVERVHVVRGWTCGRPTAVGAVTGRPRGRSPRQPSGHPPGTSPVAGDVTLPPLSVLDSSPVASGRSPADALRETLDLAGAAERAGYRRYWVAEHHGFPGGASSAPPVLIAAIAAATSRIRVGSGGVMLSNHAPLAVAEQFGTLEALNPGRIDLGLGRAPGSDQLTAYALRRWSARPGEQVDDDFGQRLAELMAFFGDSFPADHPFARLQATPVRGYAPDVWLLGSSDWSARLAGALGLPFAYAHHFGTGFTDAAVRAYREAFRPSPTLVEPRLVVTANVVTAPSADRARELAAPLGLFFLRLRAGEPGTWPSEGEAARAALSYTPAQAATVADRLHGAVVGTPEEVVDGLTELAGATGADELMISTMTHDHADRTASYELLAEAAGMRAVEVAA